MDLKHRSYKKEILDEDVIPAADLQQNLQELDFINTWLGGHSITISGLKKLISKTNKIIICEIGCGGGDNILALNAWCKEHNITASFIGVDIKTVCIEFAKAKAKGTEVQWQINDYKNVVFDTKPDIIFSSLFCHHFTNDELTEQLKWMKENSAAGFFINDLQRNVLAWYSIKILTGIFSKSYLVKHDAPLSVARGFKKHEWIKLFKNAGISNFKINWKWAFRYLIVFKHGG